MTQKSNVFIQFITYCLLIGITHALIGPRVQYVRSKQFSFIVSISQKSEDAQSHHYHECTATLIRPKSVLTVAHCLERNKPEEIEIIAGSLNIRDGEKYYPESWITFDQWNKDETWRYRMNDIAVIILQGEGIKDIKPALIPVVFYDNLNGHTQFTIAGWGKTANDNKVQHLRTAKLFTISNEECSRKGTELKGKRFSVPENYFCSRGEPYVVSSCGDGGAPMLTKDHQVLGINIGTCPNLEGYPYNTEFLHQNVLNSHLHISYYKDFIEHVWK